LPDLLNVLAPDPNCATDFVAWDQSGADLAVDRLLALVCLSSELFHGEIATGSGCSHVALLVVKRENRTATPQTPHYFVQFF
jgi:hypothetical protein